ncbi:hypothetical protein K490DRAFT_50915 [Saccharata proteae CBS 121410]|uniref:Uncharacterized protein n=1 Tax=Saccharata proteae CBS 121410 TaxID=1314787 RepID=A0A9P4HQW5_9PEZI|nr:hypothetical protein K490DRAFT_50915 [Saccharata proteae CBS 121410]
MTDNFHPGNFTNRPREEVSEIASIGGQAGRKGGFAAMDSDWQVCFLLLLFCLSTGSEGAQEAGIRVVLCERMGV